MKTELQRVLEAYRAMEPVKDVIHMIKTQFAADRRWHHWNSSVRHFAPLRKYTYRFLKSFVNEIEAVHADVDDGLVEALMEFVLNSKLVDDALNSEAMHHVSYTVPTLTLASVFNEVGLKLWEAGWLLAEYIIAHESEFRGRKVLELGAGVGFTGMALACVCRSSRVVLTDYAPNVMQNLRYNVEVNTSKFICPVEVQTLDWDTWQPTDHEDERFDVLLAGDCAYDVAAFPPLMHVLHTNRHPQRVAIFAATIRNQKTFQELLDQLAAHRIDYVDITKSSLEKMGKQLFPYPNRDQIRICRLTRTLEKTTQ
ncbi:S-adenosyl-L-methionine-dependent methyltransferase [Phytophthora cactorum]|nr:S-adenosyl-L-methionine-dependent methyltransferase [Phytophthora cactorum]